ncbi:MAG: ogr/Delta-like zinc finger family protein [Comamonadaceae bacterium]|nr:ogr/Delta-like zinc finger family protein [Comamonadaceae bacterium]
MSGGVPRMMFLCPHCQGKAKTRTSKAMTRTLREVVYQCEDPECGHSFVVHAEAVRTLSPSARPHPSVHLPQSPQALALAAARNAAHQRTDSAPSGASA